MTYARDNTISADELMAKNVTSDYKCPRYPRTGEHATAAGEIVPLEFMLHRMPSKYIGCTVCTRACLLSLWCVCACERQYVCGGPK